MGGRQLGTLGLVATIIMFANIPAAPWVNPPDEGNASAETLVAYYNDSTHDWELLVAGVLAAAGGLLFLSFATLVRNYLPRAVERFAGASATLFLALWFATVAVATAVPATFAYSDDFAPKDGDDLRTILVLGNHYLLSFAFVAIAPFVVALSLGALRGALVPKWLGYAGLIVALLLVTTTIPLFGITIVLLLAWLLFVTIALIVRPPLATTAV